MLSMAYDFYATPRISAAVGAVYNAGDSPDAPKLRRQSWSPSVEFNEANLLTKSEYPAKAWRSPSPAEESRFDSMSFSEPTLVRGFIS
jgi:hypothetical protein